MPNLPGGPPGDYVSQTKYAAELAKERQAAQQQPAQREQQPPQQQQVSPQERDAAEKQRIVEQNERTAESRIAEKLKEQELAKQSYNRGMAQQLSPDTNRDQQAQQQRQREPQNER